MALTISISPSRCGPGGVPLERRIPPPSRRTFYSRSNKTASPRVRARTPSARAKKRASILCPFVSTSLAKHPPRREGVRSAASLVGNL